jgi:hypothetical protein
MKLQDIKFLFNSIKSLGPKQGFDYWGLYMRAKNDPRLIENWANNCDREARRLEFFQRDECMSTALRSWANTLRVYSKTSETISEKRL